MRGKGRKKQTLCVHADSDMTKPKHEGVPKHERRPHAVMLNDTCDCLSASRLFHDIHGMKLYQAFHRGFLDDVQLDAEIAGGLA